MGDWSPEMVKAELAARGLTLSALARRVGYASPRSLSHALKHPLPTAERLLATALGVAPWEIWPSRYSDHLPNRRPGYPRGKPRLPRGGPAAETVGSA
jgi:Ner family transcriptional regulator